MTWRSLSKKNEFQRVYEDGVKQVGRFLVVYLLPAEDPADQAQAVVASKKIGGAVQRNRAKRLLREALFRARKNGLFQGQRAKIAVRCGNPDRYSPVQGEDGAKQASPATCSHDRKGQEAETGQDGLWVVLVARQRILGVKSPAVTAELEDLMARLGETGALPPSGASGAPKAD